MQIVTRLSLPTVKTEGAILPAELLQQIADQSQLPGLRAEDYHLFPGEKLNEAINRAWTRCLGAWQRFNEQRNQLPTTDFGTTLTRERWLLILFQELGYGRLQTAPTFQIEETRYPISHIWQRTPIHSVSFRQDIDRTMAVKGMGKRQPHSMVQEFLNRSPDYLWGLVSNGLQLRLLRDNISLTRMAYVEFDLEAMFTGELYADFCLLWLVTHQSRVEIKDDQTPADCWLEQWSQTALKQGARALDALRDGVQDAIEALGRGFLAHRANHQLHEALCTGELTTQDYYRQLLRLVYRLIFLFAAEDRQLLLLPDASPQKQQFYNAYYSASRLRRLAEVTRGGPHPDLYCGLRQLLTLLRQGYQPLGIPQLGSFLFSERATPQLDEAELANQDLLTAVRALTFVIEGQVRRLVDYRNLGAEELGSVYESLLELHPDLNLNAATFGLNLAAGSERKTTGSYYTPTSLINALLDSALEPVVAARLRQPLSQESALLSLKIIDPACGSGHFLIAAAHRLARHLAIIRSGDEEPTPHDQRLAMAEVVTHCIYGVDMNEMAVELCKVSLWMEILTPGQPLSFLDHHIKAGNSLIGATPDLVAAGIPNDAFQPVTGDKKAVAQAVRKHNKTERTGQFDIWGVTHYIQSLPDFAQWKKFTQLAQTNPQIAEEQYQNYQTDPTYRHHKLIYDLWTAAFFWPLTEDEPTIPTDELLRLAHEAPQHLPSETVSQTNQLAKRYQFFHWWLEFPEVFEEAGPGEWQIGNDSLPPGFDVVLGNPPWERVKLQEKEFFATREPTIAQASNAAARRKLIKALPKNDPHLHQLFQQAVRDSETISHFLRKSERYPLTGVGDINTYQVFTGLSRQLINPTGRAGIIVPTGIATDYTTRQFFAEVVTQGQLVSLFDFENRRKLFAEVDSRMKFSLLTLQGPSTGSGHSSAEFAFFLYDPTELQDENRRFELTAEDFNLLNPNTQTCPVFRSRQDAELTRKLYRAAPVLVNESTGDNPWGMSFSSMFHMTNDSHLFRTQDELEPGKGYLPLYEAKLFHHFDHRFGTYATATSRSSTNLETPSLAQHRDPTYRIQPWYWVAESEVQARVKDARRWFMAFRDITNTTNERTGIFGIIPWSGVGHTAPLLFTDNFNPLTCSCFVANVNMQSFDFVVRQKIGGTHLTFFIVKQLPVLPPDRYTPDLLAYIVPRVLELSYTAWDLRPFADDVWREAGEDDGRPGNGESYTNPHSPLQQAILDQWQANRLATDGGHAGAEPPAWADVGEVESGESFPRPPFMWAEVRRAQLRAELDGLYAHLYGLSREELAYILETFPIVKRKDEATYGEYRTQRLVLEAYDSQVRSCGFSRLCPAEAGTTSLLVNHQRS